MQSSTPNDESAPEHRGVSRRDLLRGVVGGVGLFVAAEFVRGPANGRWGYPGVDGRSDIPPKPAGAIRVAVFNCRRGTVNSVPAPLRDFAIDLKATIGVCRSFGADIISLSEVDESALRSYRARQTAIIARQLDMDSIYAPTVRGNLFPPERIPLLGGSLLEGPRGNRGDALLTKGHALDDAGFVLSLPYVRENSHDPNTKRTEPRSLIIRHVQFDDLVVCVCSTHLGVVSREDTTDQLRAALRCIEEYRRDGAAVLFPGDFNIPPDIVEKTLGEFPNLGLQRLQNTVPTYPNGSMPDHVTFAGFSPVGMQVVPTPISDHFGLIGDFVPLDRGINISASAGRTPTGDRGAYRQSSFVR